MRKLTFIILLLSSFAAFAQPGHISYGDVQNKIFVGRTVIQRTDAANLDTLTAVYDGTFAYDTLKRHFVGDEGVRFNELAFGRVRDTSITIATASVLTLNSVPVTLVGAQGSGTIVQVIEAFGYVDFQTTPYATNIKFEIKNSGATIAQMEHSYFINATIAKYDAFVTRQTTSVSNENMAANAALVATVDMGDPTAGDSDITIYLRYRIIELEHIKQ